MPNALASYLPKERRAAANERLAEARTFLDASNRAWEGRDPHADPDDLRMLREQLQGARADVNNWLRYIKSGCPRSR